MAQLKTYRVWFKDDSMMMVTATDTSAAKVTASGKSAENLKDAYFETPAERKRASAVQSVECLDD